MLAVPLVQIGFSANPANTEGYLYLDDPIRGRLDTGRLGPDELWSDVTPWLHTFTTRRGATRAEGPVLRYEAGTASVVLRNERRRFDPTNLSGPYVSAGVTQVEPMREIRFRVAVNGAVYDLWRGFIDDWQIEYPSPTYSRVTVTATDGQKVLASYDRPPLAAPVGAGELSGARVHRILDSVGWPVQDRVIDPGNSTMQGTVLEGDAWAELQLVADSELGEIFLDAAGRVTFRQRRAISTRPASITAQATFGSRADLGELYYEALVPAYDDAEVRNLIRIARAGGVEQVAQDPASRSKYLTKVHSRGDLLLTSDALCLDYAQFLLYQSARPELRFVSMTVDPAPSGAAGYAQCFGRDFADRIRVVSRPPGTGSGAATVVSDTLIVSDTLLLSDGGGPAPISRDVFVRGIEQTYSGPGRWKTGWALQSATRYQFLVLDDPALGRLDYAVLIF